MLTLQLKRGKSIINKVLLKKGYSAFSLEILEYCDKSEVISRSLQYFLDILKPYYNILKIAGSTQGSKHSPETIAKIRASRLGTIKRRRSLNLNLGLVVNFYLKLSRKLKLQKVMHQKRKKLDGLNYILIRRIKKE